MKIFRLMWAACSKPQKLVQAEQLKHKTIWLYLLLLSFIAALPLSINTGLFIQEMGKDSQEISEHIPDFTIKDGKLHAKDDKGFVYNADTLNFTFDPQGKLSDNDIKSDATNNFMSIAFMQDHITIIFMQNDQQFSYQTLKNLTGEDLRNSLSSVKNSQVLSTLLATLFITLLTLAGMAFYNLFCTIFANFISAFSRRLTTFGNNWKIIAFAGTLPTLFFTLLNGFGIPFAYENEVTIVITLVIYWMAIKSKKQLTLDDFK